MTHRLRVNPIACSAHGMCAELLPERISLDAEATYGAHQDNNANQEKYDERESASPRRTILFEDEPEELDVPDFLK